jgi:hypothetical protein
MSNAVFLPAGGVTDIGFEDIGDAFSELMKVRRVSFELTLFTDLGCKFEGVLGLIKAHRVSTSILRRCLSENSTPLETRSFLMSGTFRPPFDRVRLRPLSDLQIVFALSIIITFSHFFLGPRQYLFLDTFYSPDNSDFEQCAID